MSRGSKSTCCAALPVRSPSRRIGLIQIEWNQMSAFALGTDRRPVAELLAGYGYRLYRPDATGRLIPVVDPGFGADVFASPVPGGPLS